MILFNRVESFTTCITIASNCETSSIPSSAVMIAFKSFAIFTSLSVIFRYKSTASNNCVQDA